MPTVTFKKTGTAPEDTPWDWSADTQNKILGDSGDDWANYKAAHTWFDDADGDTPEKKAPYKLPHHRQGDNGLEAVWHGVANAMARLEQTDLPDADVEAAHSHLSKHYAQWDKDPPELERILAKVRANRARVRAAGTLREEALPASATRASISIDEARPNGQPNDDDLARINQLARSPLSADQVYVFPVEMSSQVIDAYYTRMTTKTLAQFAARANEGIAVCDSHEHRQLPIGRSYYGETAMVDRDGGQVLTARAMDYMLRGVQTPSGVPTNDIIRGIEAGINNDVSVGFNPQAYWCSVCGLNMLRDWSCFHWPGQTYEVSEQGKDPQQVLCVADVDADLCEHSLVYDGATPNAMVLKAQMEMEAGRANLRLLSFVEDHCRIKLYDRWQGFQASKSGLAVPAGSTAARTALPPASAAPTDSEEEDMKGTEVVDAVKARMVEALERAGKKLSSANEAKLNDIREQLQNGHDTHAEAIRLLGDFIADNGSAADDEDEQGSDNEKGAKVQRAGKSGGKGKSSNAKKDDGKDDMKGGDAEPAGDDDGDGDSNASGDTHGDEEDGENPPPDDEDGNGDDKAEEETEDETGADKDGEDKDDAKKPGKGKNAAPKSEPGTDDGDGDDDDPPEMEESDEDDTEPGSPKSDKGKNAAPAAARKKATRAPDLTPEAQEALAYFRKAREEAVDAALRAVGRALGSALTAESLTAYRAMLERASLEEIGRFRDDWQKLAKQELSPRGTPTLDPSAPGGVRWSDEPTNKGGRQTQARDPGDPAGMVPAGARVRGHTPSIGPASAAADPSLYTAGRRRSTRR